MFTLAHLSDPHLPMPKAEPLQLLNKRATGYLNWWRNRHRIHVPEALAGDSAFLQMHHQRLGWRIARVIRVLQVGVAAHDIGAVLAAAAGRLSGAVR